MLCENFAVSGSCAGWTAFLGRSPRLYQEGKFLLLKDFMSEEAEHIITLTQLESRLLKSIAKQTCRPGMWRAHPGQRKTDLWVESKIYPGANISALIWNCDITQFYTPLVWVYSTTEDYSAVMDYACWYSQERKLSPSYASTSSC